MVGSGCGGQDSTWLFFPLLFPALFHMAGHESVEWDGVTDVTLNSELEAASRFFFSPVFAYLPLLFSFNSFGLSRTLG